MATNNQVITARRKIAGEYCRSILWLDDEIKPHAADPAEREPYLRFFHPISEGFHSRGVLCQLKTFPQIEGDDDPYAPDADEITICQNLARMADIVVLDWHLGAQDPTHSIKILNGLIGVGGTRFIIVLSRETKLRDEFESEFGESFEKFDTGWYRNHGGQFVTLLSKSEFGERGGADTLLDRIYDELAIVYPDYLHWAAIEIAARIKICSPQWLASLPNNTDLAILAEHIHSSESIGDAVVDNLLEDLKESIGALSIDSVSAPALKASDWPKKEDFDKKIERDVQTLDQQQDLKTLVPHVRNLLSEESEGDNVLSEKTIGRIFGKAGHLESIKEFKESVESLGDFSEVRSIFPNNTNVIRTGSVFKSDIAEDSNKIWVCISQSCDCARDNNLLFLVGIQSEAYDPGPGSTFLRFDRKPYIFHPSAATLNSLQISENPRSISGFTQVGILREVAVTRLVSRYWAHTTRVGINQPKFLRDLRKER